MGRAFAALSLSPLSVRRGFLLPCHGFWGLPYAIFRPRALSSRGSHQLQRLRVSNDGEHVGAAQIGQAKADRVLSGVGREDGGFVKDAWAKYEIANGCMKQHRNVRFAETGATGWAVHACVDSQWQRIVEAVRWNEGAAINDLDLHRGLTDRTTSLVQTGLIELCASLHPAFDSGAERAYRT